MGPEFVYRLSKDHLEWEIGNRSGRVSYPMIKRVRLGYKPTNLATSRFLAEIWPLNAPKLQLMSVSAKSIIDLADRGGEYSFFVEELHKRLRESKADCRYEAGFPAWRWWPSVALGVVTFAALIYLIVQALLTAQYLFTLMAVLIGGWFMWQIWQIVMRNRPRVYTPDSIPSDLLPARSA